MAYEITAAVQQLASDSWIIGGRIRISRTDKKRSACCWSDGNGQWFDLNEFINTQVPTPGRRVEVYHTAGDSHAIWKLGEAFIKVSNVIPDTTPEHVTLSFLQHRKTTFAVPSPLWHGQWDGRYYLVVSELPGKTLRDVWHTKSETEKDHIVEDVRNAIQQMSRWTASKIGGVDAHHLPEYYLQGTSQSFIPDNLAQNCIALGMDCTEFHFYHCDLTPSNILVGDQGLGIIDWECAGYVPKDWIRTKFRLSSAMDLDHLSGDAKYEWRTRMQKALGAAGFDECAEQFMKWSRRDG